jgi:murein L,D-transpeptidase YafK
MTKNKLTTKIILATIALGIVGAVANWRGDSAHAKLAADRVVVRKGHRQLHLLLGQDTTKTYRIALGRNPFGPKRTEGDGRTPEGNYVLDFRKPRSSFHLAIHISYPNAADRAQAQLRGVSSGGLIMIHGLPNGLGWLGKIYNLIDWTDGCIAVTDSEIEEIWDAVPDGTPISILP